MCGIVGYIGKANAKEIIVEGLRRLEYRGYDSAGIALYRNGKIETRKHVGELKNLEKIIADPEYDSYMGIGHTRWATHGVPSDINAHPHSNSDNTITVVHNGIIENFLELRRMLEEEHNVVFRSDTDTEVIAHLISLYYDGDLHEAVNKAVAKMRGAYAIAVICASEPDKIIGVRKDAPLVAGIGEGCNFLASDIPAFLRYVRRVIFLENNETVVVTREKITIYDENNEQVEREPYHVDWDVDAAEKGGYPFFMMKEIHEQPKALADTLKRRLDENGDIVLDGISLAREDIDRLSRIYIVACGTAYHAGLVGKYVIEKMTRIPVEVDVASEFRYRDPYVDENTLFIAISQSGETQDTLAALREAKGKGARILSVVNVVGSSVARESDDVFYTWAGPEIAVASTKAYVTQLMCMYMIGLYMGRLKGTLAEADYHDTIRELLAVPDKLAAFLEDDTQIKNLAKRFYRRNEMFYIGRGLDSTVAYEGSLKMKEISYINTFAIAAGELKHGTIALVEEGTLFITLATQDKLFEKMLSNIEEIRARGAYVVAVAKEGNREIETKADEVIYIPSCPDDLTPLLSVVPLQLFAYHVADARKNNIDKPRNLAKSVTVE
ncbi:MAG: glutamine--fructose-6-phosphate transaminase (isomerizing) [Eubacteriales bacterium]|nr:glutamine--fructose-6-phosphate transaminase (isomerizing) [Eubacteriales bacterium]